MSSSTATPTASGTAFAGPPSPPRAGPQPPSPPQSSAGAASDVFGSTNSLHAADGDGWHDADGDDADVQVDSLFSFVDEPHSIGDLCRCTPKKPLLKASAALLAHRRPTGAKTLTIVHVKAKRQCNTGHKHSSQTSSGSYIYQDACVCVQTILHTIGAVISF